MTGRLVLSLLLGALVAAGWATPANAAGQPTYAGRAYAVGLTDISVNGTAMSDQYIADTGALPSSGGDRTAGSGTQQAPGLGSVDVLLEAAHGKDGHASASSRVAGVHLFPQSNGPDLLDAALADASTTADVDGKPSATAALLSVDINGSMVAIPPGSNVTVTVPGPSAGSVVAVVTFNAESTASNSPSASALIVQFPPNGVLSAQVVGRVTVSHAESAALLPLDISKLVNGLPAVTVLPHSNVTYTITITNNTTAACTLSSVTDNLPPGPGEGGVPFTYVSGGPAGATLKQSSGAGRNVAAWTFTTAPVLAPKAAFAFAFIAFVPKDEAPGTYTDEATYTASCGSGTTGNTAKVTVPPGGVLATTAPPAGTPFTAALAHPLPWGQLVALLLALSGLPVAALLRRRSR